MIPCAEALARVQFTKEEERAAAKIEAVIDGVIRDKFDGVSLQLPFSEQIAPKLAYALQRKYERGGWKMTVSAGAKLTVQLTPTVTAPVTIDVPASVAPPPVEVLPPVTQLALQAVAIAGRKLLVRMPTRGRPVQAIKVLELYRSMAGCPIQIEVVIDVDDETMLACEVQQRLVALGCVITAGKHKSKIEAVNGGRLLDWDVLLLASDDMWPTDSSYAVKVLDAMEQHFPHLDGAVYFDDGFHGPNLCTLPVMGRRWWEQQGRKVYAEEYESLSCDTEQTQLWLAMGRLAFVDQKIIEHRHPVWGKADTDALYDRNNALTKRDEAVYEQRKMVRQPFAQWTFNSPPLWLSVLVCTIPSRKVQLDYLLTYLWDQIARLPEPLNVEILVDGGEGTTGVKHQRLIERARGHYVAFVDDDDLVSHDYMERVVSTIVANPDADCLSLRGVMTTAGEVPEPFYHSIENTEWGQNGDGVHVRGPNHLNPVRRTLALQTGFSEIHYTDDVDFGKRLRPLLHKEASTGDDPLYMYFFSPRKG